MLHQTTLSLNFLICAWNGTHIDCRLFLVRFFKTQGEKNSSPEKTQGNFGAKTQGTGAFYINFLSKLNLLELFCRFGLKTQWVWALYWYLSFISHSRKVIEPINDGLIHWKTTFFLKLKDFFAKLNDRFPKLKDFFQNSTILKKKTQGICFKTQATGAFEHNWSLENRTKKACLTG